MSSHRNESMYICNHFVYVIYYKYHYSIEKGPKTITIVCYKLVFYLGVSLTKLFTSRISSSLGSVSVVLFL